MTQESILSSLQLDDEGFLANSSDWDLDIARQLAKAEGIDLLTERHWHVIHFLRELSVVRGSQPTLRSIKRDAGVPTFEFYQLFKKRPLKTAARIAGIPKPTGCV